MSQLGQVFHSTVIDVWTDQSTVLGVPELGMPQPWRGGGFSFSNNELQAIVLFAIPQSTMTLFLAFHNNWPRELAFEAFSKIVQKKLENSKVRCVMQIQKGSESPYGHQDIPGIIKGVCFPILSPQASICFGLFIQSE